MSADRVDDAERRPRNQRRRSQITNRQVDRSAPDATARVSLGDLYGDQIPQWVLDRARPRYEAWRRKHPNEAPGPKLVWEWALDNSGLPASHRRVLDRLASFDTGSAITFGTLAFTAGLSSGHLRYRVTPRLIEWGWLDKGPAPNGNRDGHRWTVCVPLEAPPNRVAQPARARPQANRFEHLTPRVSREDPARLARGPRASRAVDPARLARHGDEEGAKGASTKRIPDVAASLAPSDQRFTRTDTRDDARFWTIVHAVENREDCGLPTLQKQERYRLVRLIACAVPDDRDHHGDDRAVIILEHLATLELESAAELHRTAIHELGLDPELAHLYSRGRYHDDDQWHPDYCGCDQCARPAPPTSAGLEAER